MGPDLTARVALELGRAKVRQSGTPQRQRNVSPAGSRPIVKAGFTEGLHPRGYHGKWIGKGGHELRRGALVRAPGSEGRAIITAKTIIHGRGPHVEVQDIRGRKSVHAAGQVEHVAAPNHGSTRSFRAHLTSYDERGRRDLSGSQLAREHERYYTQTYRQHGAEPGNVYAPKRAHELTRGFTDIEHGVPFAQQEFTAGDARTPNLTPEQARSVLEHYRDQHIAAHPHSAAARAVRGEGTGVGSPEVHAHQVGTIVEHKHQASPSARGPAKQYMVTGSSPEGADIVRQGSRGPSHTVPHEDLVPTSAPRGWSNNEVAQHERNLRGSSSMADHIAGRVNELRQGREAVDELRQAAADAGAYKTDSPTPEPSNTPFSHEKLIAAYHHSSGSLTHHQPLIPISRDEYGPGGGVAKALHSIGDYNDFSPSRVRRALEPAGKKGAITHLMFGRESSPVIYARPSNPQGARDAVHAFTRAGADEVHVTREGNIRAWWD